uniref:Putative secreted protein n=1 Tax=Xenopsylla cheopis TaxID=163159 RepID=A0A6M2E426_XENCH
MYYRGTLILALHILIFQKVRSFRTNLCRIYFNHILFFVLSWTPVGIFSVLGVLLATSATFTCASSLSLAGTSWTLEFLLSISTC